MNKSALTKGYGLLKASHFGPLTIVVVSSFIVASIDYDLSDSIRIAIAIFAGQLFVGWSNDLIDYQLDLQANRLSKPLVSGSISKEFLRTSIYFALVATLLISLLSPLKIIGTIFHLMGLVSAFLYNIKLKATVFSPVPYLISFAALSLAIYLPLGFMPPLWIFLGYLLFPTAFHFFNVLKDLEKDVNQGILGFPQRIGRSWSIAVAITLLLLGIIEIFVINLM